MQWGQVPLSDIESNVVELLQAKYGVASSVSTTAVNGMFSAKVVVSRGQRELLCREGC